MEKCNITATLLLMGLLTTGFTSCSSDSHEPDLQPTLPGATKNKVTSITYLGQAASNYNWTFTYSNMKMIAAEGHFVEDIGVVNKDGYNYRMEYGPQNVSITSTAHNNLTPVLVTIRELKEARICKMTVDKNDYSFSYNSDGYLSSWTRQNYSGSSLQGSSYATYANLTYNNGDLTNIHYTRNSDYNTDVVEYTFKYDTSYPNTNGLLCPVISEQMGIHGLEYLYYSGLIGKASKHLPSSLIIKHTKADGTSSSNNISFVYTQRDYNVYNCQYTFPGNESATIVNYTYTEEK